VVVVVGVLFGIFAGSNGSELVLVGVGNSCNQLHYHEVGLCANTNNSSSKMGFGTGKEDG